jgi:hypothetical protein
MEIRDDESERSFIWFYTPLQNSVRIYEIYRPLLQMTRRIHWRAGHPTTGIPRAPWSMVIFMHVVHERDDPSPLPHLEYLFSCIRHIGALTAVANSSTACKLEGVVHTSSTIDGTCPNAVYACISVETLFTHY